MAKGLGGKKENIEIYMAWKTGKSLTDFAGYIQRRKEGDFYKWSLSRGKINKELNIGSAISQNSDIRESLDDIETDMRAAGLLPPDEPVISTQCENDSEEDLSSAIDLPHTKSGLNASEKRRLNELEVKNASLHEELKEKSDALKRYELMERFLTDTMRLPR